MSGPFVPKPKTGRRLGWKGSERRSGIEHAFPRSQAPAWERVSAKLCFATSRRAASESYSYSYSVFGTVLVIEDPTMTAISLTHEKLDAYRLSPGVRESSTSTASLSTSTKGAPSQKQASNEARRSRQKRGYPAPFPRSQSRHCTGLSRRLALLFSRRGPAGAGSYTIQRAAEASGPWKTVTDGVSATVPCYRPLFADSSARPGEAWFYRVIAHNEGGASVPSIVVGPIRIRRAVLADELKTFDLTADRSQGLTPLCLTAWSSGFEGLCKMTSDFPCNLGHREGFE